MTLETAIKILAVISSMLTVGSIIDTLHIRRLKKRLEVVESELAQTSYTVRDTRLDLHIASSNIDRTYSEMKQNLALQANAVVDLNSELTKLKRDVQLAGIFVTEE